MDKNEYYVIEDCPSVAKMLASEDVTGLISILQDNVYCADSEGIWYYAYAALYLITKKTPLSNPEMRDIAKAIAIHFNYRLAHKAGIPEKEIHYKEDNENVRKNIQKLMNLEIFRDGRLPEQIWEALMSVLLDF
jgi:hypothetical protein